MKKILKILLEILFYTLLIGLNLIALLLLFNKRYNEIELMISSNFVDFFIYLKLLGIHLVIGLIILIAFYFLRKWKFYYRMLLAMVFILISTSYFYYDYYKNTQVISAEDKKIIESIKSKKKVFQAMTLSNKFSHLTYEEYKFIGGVKSANVPTEAYDIDYEYTSDGSFIGDHKCNISYKISLESKIDTFNYENNQSRASKSIEKFQDFYQVKYSSDSW